MSIDYEQLQARLAKAEDTSAHRLDRVAANVVLEANAKDMARELLRLRDEVEKLREMCLLERDAAFQETPMRAGEVEAFNICADQLTDLLNGDTE